MCAYYYILLQRRNTTRLRREKGRKRKEELREPAASLHIRYDRFSSSAPLIILQVTCVYSDFRVKLYNILTDRHILPTTTTFTATLTHFFEDTKPNRFNRPQRSIHTMKLFSVYFPLALLLLSTQAVLCENDGGKCIMTSIYFYSIPFI